MEYRKLGRSDISVSALCLGTMTYGTQTSEHAAHRQIDVALDRGVNFLDTAEMYPTTPIAAETVGNTERIIGNWFANGGQRERLILATKHSGEGFKIGGTAGAPISAATISGALDATLARLQTDYVDLYQFHWPNRGSYMFRKNWAYDPSGNDPKAEIANFSECLEVLAQEVEKGRIRAFGLSNESAWGMAQWLRLAEAGAGPRPVSVQNEYSLMCRLFDTDLAELCLMEDVGLLAFSPLACGILSGKYLGGQVPENSRKAINDALGGRVGPREEAAAAAYVAVARDHGYDPVQLSLAWAAQRPFMASVIFGATTAEQLEVALGAVDIHLTDDVLRAIDETHRAHPMPY